MRFNQLALLASLVLVLGCDDKGQADKANEALKAGEAAKAKAGEAIKAGGEAAKAGAEAAKVAGADAIKAGGEAAKAAGEAAKAGAEAAKVAGAEAVKAAGDAVQAAGDDAAKAAAVVAAMAPTGNPLTFVPADSPYVFANIGGLPQAFTDKLGKALDPLFKKFDEELASEKAKLGDGPDDRVAKALLEEIQGNLSREGLARLGFDPEFRFVIYGLGLLPVVRIDLKDADALRAAITRVETKSGVKAPTAKAGDLDYWRIQEDGMTVVIAITGKQLVVGVTPDATADKAVPFILGQQLPEANAAAAMAAVAGRNGYQGTYGYIDSTIIAATLMGDAKGLAGEVFTALSHGEMAELPGTCKAEITGMVGNFPRLSFGYTELSGEKMSARYVLEMSAALAQELKGLTTNVPGLGQDDGALMAFGAGINVQKTLDFAKAKVAALKAAPYTCPLLADFNSSMAELDQGLQAPMPPFVTGVRGFNVVIKDGKIGPNGPTAVRGTLLISADKANELFEMAKGMAPPLASLQVPADGTPTALPPGLVPPVVDAPFIAVNTNGIALSVGVGEEKNLTGLLGAPSAGGGPVVAFTYDIKRFLGMMGDQMGAGMGAEEKMVFDALTGILGTTRYVLDFQDAGVVVSQHLTLP